MRVVIGVIRHAESSEIISSVTRLRTSGLNRKLPVLRDFKEINGNLKVKTVAIEDAE